MTSPKPAAERLNRVSIVWRGPVGGTGLWLDSSMDHFHQGLSSDAGFQGVDVLDVDHPQFRLYRLR